MHFIILYHSDLWVHNFYFSFLNHVQDHKMNIPAFLFVKIEKSIEDFHKSKGQGSSSLGYYLHHLLTCSQNNGAP